MGGVVGGRGAGKAAEGIIAKAVKDLFRVAEKDAGKAAARDAERAAAKDAARTAGRDAERQATRDAERRAEREAAARAEARRTCGDPVDVATGEVVVSHVDTELAGVLPLVLTRTHVSSYRDGRFFGTTWASTVDQRVELSAGGARYLAEDGMVLSYPLPAPGGSALPAAGPRWPLADAGDGRFSVTDPDSGTVRWFARPDGAHEPTLALSAVTDRSGRHRYDLRYEDGIPTAIEHSGGYVVAIASEDGRITGYTLASAGGVPLVSFGYDQSGRLASIVNSSGQPLRLGHDADGRLAWWTDRNGTGYRYEYDDAGRCVAAGGPSGHQAARFDYGDGSRTEFTDSLGHTRVFELNEVGQLVAETDPLGNTTRMRWDAFDRLVERTDPLGATTSWRYDSAGDLVAFTRAGRTSTAAYNRLHQAVAVTGPGGESWAAEYDPVGQLLAITNPAGARTSYGYRDGRLTSITDALGRAQRIGTDAAGLVTSVAEAGGGLSSYERDGFGRVGAVTDPLGNTTRYGWTIEGLPALRELPDGSTARWEYDGEGNEVSFTDPLGQRRTAEFGAFDLPAVTVDLDGRRSVLAHDTELRLTAVTNARGETWHFAYDAAGRLVGETDFAGRGVGYGYDPAGRLVWRQGPGGRTDLVRDAAGEIVEVRRASAGRPGEVLRYERDAAGRVLRASGPGGTLTRGYDPVGRVVSESVNGRTVTFRYDPLGRVVGRRTPAGVDSAWEYGDGDLPVALHSGGDAVRFGYDAAGREVARRFGPDLLFVQTWDANSRLSGLSVTAGGLAQDAPESRPVARRSYGYRADGHPTALEDALTGRQEFALDPAGRVTAVDAPGWSERYGYDALGSLATAGWGPVPEPARVPTGGRYEYDGAGRVVARTERTLSGMARTWRYAWNADDQLVEALTPDGERWRYSYDPLGRRCGKERLGPGGETLDWTAFCWDGTRLIEQTAATGASTTWEYRPGSYQPLAQTWQSDVDRRFHAIVTDLVGTPTELVTPGGEVAWRQRRTLWGVPVAGGGGTDCPLRAAGQYLDVETGLHYNLARHYDPGTGTYASQDPLGLVGGPDPRAYVPNPLVWLDPLGLACRTVYRQLSAADREAFDRGEGLAAKGTSRDIAEHIRGGDTRHISASLTEGQAERFASGNGLVAIDVDEAIRGGARYIDHGNVMQAAGRASDATRLKPLAERAGEVLFIDQIPFSAMRLVR